MQSHAGKGSGHQAWALAMCVSTSVQLLVVVGCYWHFYGFGIENFTLKSLHFWKIITRVKESEIAVNDINHLFEEIDVSSVLQFQATDI